MSELNQKAVEAARRGYQLGMEHSHEDCLQAAITAYLAAGVGPDLDWINAAHLICDRLGIERKADTFHIVDGITAQAARIGELEGALDERT